MTDQELIKLAFKAAFNGVEITDDKDMLKRWNPLDNDIDAFTLMVDMKMSLLRETLCNTKSVSVIGDLYDGKHLTAFRWAWVPLGNDPYAATRRAITMAAAAMVGQKIPNIPKLKSA